MVIVSVYVYVSLRLCICIFCFLLRSSLLLPRMHFIQEQLEYGNCIGRVLRMTSERDKIDSDMQQSWRTFRGLHDVCVKLNLIGWIIVFVC